MLDYTFAMHAALSVVREFLSAALTRMRLALYPPAHLSPVPLPHSADPYVVLHPAGPVAADELHLLTLAAIVMAAFIVPVLALFGDVAVRYRARPGREPRAVVSERRSGWLEALWLVLPAVVLTIIAVPTVGLTYALARVPKGTRPLVIDVTSLDWKWLFEYPAQGIATVNYVAIPAGRPVLFELTADSPMNTFWVPRLGGMEYTMPGRVLPLWLEADRPGLFWGHSGQFSGLEFDAMFFDVRALTAHGFARWTRATGRRPAMTRGEYAALLRPAVVPASTYGGFPTGTFPAVTHGFTLSGGMYNAMLPAAAATARPKHG
jgi:heme/copper-type cytochrome/quinol oxidase subunit 2